MRWSERAGEAGAGAAAHQPVSGQLGGARTPPGGRVARGGEERCAARRAEEGNIFLPAGGLLAHRLQEIVPQGPPDYKMK